MSDEEHESKHPRLDELIPEGITYNRPGRSFPASFERGVEGGAPHTSTFSVEAKHSKLAKGKGVNFNVETVPEPLESHLHKGTLSRKELIQNIKETCAKHHTRQEQGVSDIRYNQSEIKMEALCETNNDRMVHVGGNGFIMACVTAFAQHLPLTLSPDHIWILISYAFAKHVDQNAEQLRQNFVHHEGKQRLLVETPSGFAMSDGTDPDTGASAKQWETHVFPMFSSQIKGYIGEKTHQAIAADFSTTTATAQAANEITLMSAMKNYFSYGMTTFCGIPNITLLGKLDDWVALRARAEGLRSLMMPEFHKMWMPHLLPVLDEFVASFKGNVNHGFWQSMVKLRNTGGGSGSYSFISGWVQVFFPYLASGSVNRHLRPWHEMYFEGPTLSNFPLVASFAPVDWDYLGTTYDLTFHAGILGFTQDEVTGALSPKLGWYVAHAPKSNQLKLQESKKELGALLAGHKDEIDAGHVDEGEPWAVRVRFLRDQIADLKVDVALVDASEDDDF